MPSNDDKPHHFHAEAYALSGSLTLPFQQEIKKQAFVKLEGTLAQFSEDGQRNYLAQRSQGFALETLVSYSAAHTQVYGFESRKHPGASVTVATSVVEGLNILNVVTADRVVAQVSTTHFPGVVAPRVTFLGTQFENLKIFRHKVEPKLDWRFCEGDPANDKQHFVEKEGFLSAVGKYAQLNESAYSKGVLDVDKIKALVEAGEAMEEKEGHAVARRAWSGIKCSLADPLNVQAPDGEDQLRTFGHMLDIPHFGRIFLAELSVNHNSFHLTMIRLELGCLVDGKISVGVNEVNGTGKGG